MLSRPAQKGVSLVELLIGIAVLALLIAAGLPNITQFLQNTQLRGRAESIMSGIQLARTEALRRNTAVRFTLTTDITGSCAASSTGTAWVVSMDDPSGSCDSAVSETAAPRILQARGAEGGANAEVQTSGGAAQHTLVFNALGRLTTNNPNNFTQVDVSNPVGGTCQHVDANGKMRCLRLVVTTGGDVRMCDPKVTDPTDPRIC